MAVFPQVGDRFGRYRIVGRLGRGGMGVVFRAVRDDLDREVALKVLSPEHAEIPEFRERFVREAAMLGTLQSPHVIAIYEHGEHDGCLFIATQLVRGGDLRESLRVDGPMPFSQALELAAQLADALGDAHAAGVVHRDVKPSNVLLRRTPHTLHAYLCDFGIARTRDAQLTQAGVLVGSYGYLAPERLLGEPATPASDLYSLGCLLVTAATGVLPYSGSDAEVAEQHLRSPVPQWDETSAGHAAVNAVLRRAMAKDPTARYGSAEEMRVALVDARTAVRGQAAGPVGEPTTVRDLPRVGSEPDRPVPERTGDPRRLALLGAIALVAVLVVAGAVAWAVGRQGPDDPSTSAGPGRSSAPTASSGSSRAPSEPCWDGDAPVASTCSLPRGVEGLRWVFPSLDRNQGCRPGVPSSRKLLARNCRIPLDDRGTIALTTYSMWRSWESADRHYRIEEYPGLPARARGGVLTYGPRRLDDGRYRASVMYAAGSRVPYSATVVGLTETDVRQGMALVDVRPPAEFR
ncbi:MAG: pknH [Marmoricola sp.]|nr:pknH [Marmoricola sp.]